MDSYVCIPRGYPPDEISQMGLLGGIARNDQEKNIQFTPQKIGSGGSGGTFVYKVNG